MRMHDIVCRINEHLQRVWLLVRGSCCGTMTFKGTNISFNYMEVSAITLTWTASWKERDVQAPSALELSQCSPNLLAPSSDSLQAPSRRPKAILPCKRGNISTSSAVAASLSSSIARVTPCWMLDSDNYKVYTRRGRPLNEGKS